MSYRKFKGDQLFTGTEMMTNKVLVTDHEGVIEAVIDEEDGGDVETLEGILSPGFINAHCHLELSHMKGLIPERTGLVDFVYKVVSERHFPEEDILRSIEKAEEEMMANGIVAAGDICNNLLTLPQKQKNRVAYYNFIEASGWLPEVSQLRFERALKIYQEFTARSSPLTAHSSVVPHAPYSVSEELWNLIIPYFENKVVSIHNQETSFEDEFFLHGTGDLLRMYELMKIDTAHHRPSKTSSLQSYFSKLTKAASVILVHNTFTRQQDIDHVKERSAHQLISFCICINANQYIENSLPPLELLIKNNCNIIMGTDSIASNRSLSLLDEMRTIQKNFTGITLQEMLPWATLNGAQALQKEKVYGSFDKGKKPGIVLIKNVEGSQLHDRSAVQRIL